MGLRFEEKEKLRIADIRVEESRPGGYIPEEHVKDMDIDRVDIGILYPTVGLFRESWFGGSLWTRGARNQRDEAARYIIR